MKNRDIRLPSTIYEEIHDVDGIFYSSDRLAVGGLKYFYDRKISVPEQIAVIGFDDIPQCTQVVPNLTTVHQHYMEFGELAARYDHSNDTF